MSLSFKCIYLFYKIDKICFWEMCFWNTGMQYWSSKGYCLGSFTFPPVHIGLQVQIGVLTHTEEF